MDPSLVSRTGLDLESWLRTPWKRLTLVALLVLMAATVTTLQVHVTTLQMHEWLSLGDRDVRLGPVVAHQLLFWSLWGLLGWPIVLFGRWLARVTRIWIVFLLLQVPISLGVAYGFVEYNRYLGEVVQDESPFARPSRGRGLRGERGDAGGGNERGEVERGLEGAAAAEGVGAAEGAEGAEGVGRGAGAGRGSRGPREGRGPRRGFRDSLPFRLPRELFVYWVVLGIGAGSSAFLKTRSQERRAAALELRAARLDAELARSQVDSLRDQLHPHFLFNALHAVGGLVRSGDGEKALGTLSALGELLRTTLDHGGSQEGPLRDELRVAERYLDIERIRLGDRLAVTIEADPGVLDARVPVLSLLPLVENAVRHGVAPRTEGGRVSLTARREGASLCIEVCDDGPGFPAEMLRRVVEAEGDTTGRRRIGLANDRERLRRLYGERHRFELANDPAGGARVRIEVPWALYEEHDA